jgi:hypothetical protein
MKLTTVVVCGFCAAVGARAAADTFVVPHILESSGHATINGNSSPLHTPLQTSTSVDVFGPDGDTGAFTYNYADTIRWHGTDFQGRAFTMDFSVLFCQSRPEGGDFRFEMLATPTLVSLDGSDINAPGDFLDLTTLVATPEPIGSGTGVTLDVPAMHFAAVDGGGRNMTVDFDAGTLRLIPSPVSAAVLAIAGLFKLRRHR